MVLSFQSQCHINVIVFLNYNIYTIANLVHRALLAEKHREEVSKIAVVTDISSFDT